MSTEPPLTWQAIERIADLLRGITVAGGYYTDLGHAKFALDRAQHPGNVASVTVLAGEITTDEANSGPRTTVSDMDVTIEYALPAGASTDPEPLAHRARADIVRALAEASRGAAPGIRTIRVTGSRIAGAVEPGTTLVIAQVSCTVGLTETRPPHTPRTP